MKKERKVFVLFLLLCLCLSSCGNHVCEENLSDWIVGREATIYAEGLEYETCKVCHKIVKERPIKKLEHDCKEYVSEWSIIGEPFGDVLGMREGFCSVCGEYVSDLFEAEDNNVPSRPVSAPKEQQEQQQQEHYSRQDIERMANGAIGKVYCYDIDGETVTTQGSAVFIDTNGNFITNAHVIKDAYYIKIKVNDRATFYDVDRICKYDENNDYAVCHMSGFTNSRHLELSQSVSSGETVYSLGYPKDAFIMDVNEGKILGEGQQYVENTAWINNGSSGGALVNSKGELVGITTASSTEGTFLAVKNGIFSSAIKSPEYGTAPIDYFYTRRDIYINAFNFTNYFDVDVTSRNTGSTIYYDAYVSLKNNYKNKNYVFDSRGSFCIDITTKYGSDIYSLNNRRSTTIRFSYNKASDLNFLTQSDMLFTSVGFNDDLYYDYDYDFSLCNVKAAEYVHK